MSTTVDTAEAAVLLFDFIGDHEGLHRKKPGDPLIYSYCDPASPLGKAIQKAGRWNDYLYRGWEIPLHDARFKGLSGAPWTIGYGSTGADIGPTTAWTLDQVKARYVTQSTAFMKQVQAAVTVPISSMQLAMLTSLSYNIGITAFRNSTLLRKLNAGDYVGAGDEFPRWNKAQGKVMPGLVTRRAAEREKFLSTMCREPG